MLNVSLKLCRNRRREEQQHTQLNTLWAANAISNRQTGRDHWAFLSMPYVNQWIIQGGGGCEVVFPNQGEIHNPFFLCRAAPSKLLAGAQRWQQKVWRSVQHWHYTEKDEIMAPPKWSQIISFTPPWWATSGRTWAKLKSGTHLREDLV